MANFKSVFVFGLLLFAVQLHTISATRHFPLWHLRPFESIQPPITMAPASAPTIPQIVTPMKV